MLSAEPASQAPSPSRFRLSVDDYYRLAELGTFKGRRVELIEGVIYQMSPVGTPHVWAVAQLNRVLLSQLQKPYELTVQCPVRVSHFSEPEPDFAILLWPASRDKATVADASLIIEVSDSSRDYDLGEKMELYARAGVPEYWVLDLQRYELVVHRQPVDGTYTKVTNHGRAETVQSQTTPAVTFTVGDALR